jgi:DNA-binding CsgD family transcriptional regulator
MRTVAHGGFYLCPRLVDGFYAQLRQPTHTDPYGLARREVETLRWIVRGLTHAQIATKMGLSRATVNTYATRIRDKLNVSSTAELTRIAIELGYLTTERRDHPSTQSSHTTPTPSRPTTGLQPRLGQPPQHRRRPTGRHGRSGRAGLARRRADPPLRVPAEHAWAQLQPDSSMSRL